MYGSLWVEPGFEYYLNTVLLYLLCTVLLPLTGGVVLNHVAAICQFSLQDICCYMTLLCFMCLVHCCWIMSCFQFWLLWIMLLWKSLYMFWCMWPRIPLGQDQQIRVPCIVFYLKKIFFSLGEIFFFKKAFIYSLDVLRLHCCSGFLGLWQAGATLVSVCRHCRGLSCCRAPAQGHVGLSSCSSRALEHRLNSCGARA